ncbi:hypothetical protein Pcinc_012262 [Petrolisthes cinctipes]|uniref:Uncharacterized protein n=1 Tax=Petrolisthes cinctipes TaxID=88211 RepID=A0AAE1G132_PETCI|nr:hypothetical protein Pcinc_012262 [Petrolisthes cinctipes]
MLYCWLFTPDIQGGWLPTTKGSMVLISEEIMGHFLPKILGMTVTVGIIPFRAFKQRGHTVLSEVSVANMEKDLELPSTSTGRRDIRGPPTVPSVTPGCSVRRRLDTSGDIRACLDDLDAYVSSDEDDITNDEFMVSREWASSSEEDVDDPLPLEEEEEEEEEVVVPTPPPGKGKGKGRSAPKPVAPAPVDLDDEDEEVELVAPTPPARKRRGGRAPPVPTPVAASTPIRGHRPAPPTASEPDPHNFQ